jgi:hypothetical protein
MKLLNLKIASLTYLKNQISIGVIFDLNQEESDQTTINEIKSMYIHKEVTIKTSDKVITTKILNVDGYSTNYEPNLLNIFFQTTLDINHNIETGNEIII